ncbi:MAG: hypothetical protein MI922_20185 [Bacteroidales bacterium]|nr:hypothetical protein [Bacteroidales bacterium]
MKQRIALCRQCEKRMYNPNLGIVCSLTKQKPDFEAVCHEYSVDKKEAASNQRKQQIEQEEKSSKGSAWAVLGFILIIIKLILVFSN